LRGSFRHAHRRLEAYQRSRRFATIYDSPVCIVFGATI